MNFKSSKLTLSLLAAVAAMTVAGAASAASPEDGPSMRVKVSDLNLMTPEGANILYRRITNAARSVCPDVHSRDLAVVAAAQRCQEHAIAVAVESTQSPQLAAIYAARVSHG